jgi:hypothetical protein
VRTLIGYDEGFYKRLPLEENFFGLGCSQGAQGDGRQIRSSDEVGPESVVANPEKHQ